MTFSRALSTNNYGPAKFIVDGTTTANGTHSTIATALTSASSGDTIFIRPGTYTENLTLKAGVNICAFECDALTPNVSIVGKCTMTTAGTVTISGIRLTTNSDYFLVVSDANASIVNLFNCYLNCSNNAGINFTSSSASSAIHVNYCRYIISNTTFSLFVSTASGQMFFRYLISDSGSATTTASTTNGTNMFVNFSTFNFPVTITAATVFFYYSSLDTSAANTTAITTVTSGSTALRNCNILSGTASAISIGASTTVQAGNCILESSNTNVVTGAGTFNFTNLTYAVSGSSVINPTTEVPSYTELGKYKAKGQPAFFAYNSANDDNVTGDGTTFTLDFDTELYDIGSNFSADTFTAPVTGIYHFDCCVLLQQLVTANTCQLNLVTTAQTYIYGNTGTSFTGNMPLSFSATVQMTAGNTATLAVIVSGGGLTVDVFGGGVPPRTFFCGYLVG